MAKLRIKDVEDLDPLPKATLVAPPRATLIGIVEDGSPYRFKLVEHSAPLADCRVLLSGLDRQRALDAVRLRQNALWRKGNAK